MNILGCLNFKIFLMLHVNGIYYNDIYKKCVVYNIESGPFNIVHGMVLV
jgi:hypothetical protein